MPKLLRKGLVKLHLKLIDLEELRVADVAHCDKNQLVDLREMGEIGEGNSESKVLDFLNYVKNPYLFKVGDIAVKVDYCEEKKLTELMVNVLNAS